MREQEQIFQQGEPTSDVRDGIPRPGRAAGELRERGGVAAAATGDDKKTVLSMDD